MGIGYKIVFEYAELTVLGRTQHCTFDGGLSPVARNGSRGRC